MIWYCSGGGSSQSPEPASYTLSTNLIGQNRLLGANTEKMVTSGGQGWGRGKLQSTAVLWEKGASVESHDWGVRDNKWSEIYGRRPGEHGKHVCVQEGEKEMPFSLSGSGAPCHCSSQRHYDQPNVTGF